MTKPVVAFQGEPGAYSEQAALELLGAERIVSRGYESFDLCFQALERGDAMFAVLPIENSLGGTVHPNYDLQLRHNFFIVAEHDFRVRHCLMVQPGVKESEIEKVLSHPQALAQCDSFLRNRNLQGVASYDTAGSAKMVSENKDGTLGKCAAIASALAAERYSMEILEAGVEDDDNNFTRFLLLSRRWLPLASKAEMKTTMVFSLVNNQPGVLVKALSAFSFREIGLSKLESRPNKLGLVGRTLIVADNDAEQQIPAADRSLIDRMVSVCNEVGPQAEGGESAGSGPKKDRFQFVFYVDCVGSLLDKPLQNALRHLSELSTFLRILGCYPKGGVLCDFVASSVGAPSGFALLDVAGGNAVRGGSAADSGSRSGPGALAPAPPAIQPLRVGIIGFGNFGQFLAKTFVKHARVFACSRTDYRKECAELGVTYTEDVEGMFQAAQTLDVLVVSVSILSFEQVMSKLPSKLLEGVLVVDVLSVKTLPKNVLQVVLPPSSDILCMHPMFGPESGKYSWRALPCVYEKVRLSSSSDLRADLRCERFLDIFRKAGCRMVEMSCEMHDQAAAGSQFVTHLTGRVLRELGLRSTPINTKGFETLLALVDNTCKDSFDLFKALYQCNPNSSAQLKAMQDSVEKITGQLIAGGNGAKQEQFTDLVNRIKPSATSATHAKAIELKRKGADIVLTLTVGEPDFAPPQPILDALKHVGEKNMTRYTAVGGLHELKQAICDDYSRRKGVSYQAQQVLITHGGKQAIFMAVLALCQKGHKVVIPAPYWVSYADIVNISGAEPVFVDRRPDNGYVLTPEQLESALTPNTQMFILCNPCNPTGCTYTRAQLEALAEVFRKPQFSHIYILSDEIYERLTYDGLEHVSFASLAGMQSRTIIVNGFAKSHAMTGFRVGWAACHDTGVITTLTKLQSQLNSCACSTSQYAAYIALTQVPEEMIQPLYRELAEKRDTMVRKLREIPNIICPVPQGAFYVFPDVSFYLGSKTETGSMINNTTDLCNYLIEQHGLALPPGDAFGAPYGVRFSYATSMEDINKAADRFRNALAKLHK